MIPKWKLKQMFREYWNDYLTIEKYSEAYGTTKGKMMRMINLGRILHDREADQLKEG